MRDGINRRDFLRSTATTGVVAGLAASLPYSIKGQSRHDEAVLLDGMAIPDEGWTLWVDREAKWETDAIFLPDDVKLAELPVHPPTGGWEMLAKPAASLPFSKMVTLPSTVEQHYWGKFGERSYANGEYTYQRDDKVPQNGAYRGVSWWWRTFPVPQEFQGRRVILHVRGARLRAEVYLNQKLVGYSILEELPFECDLTSALQFGPGAKNQLAVRITNPGGRYDWADGDLTPWGHVSFYAAHGFGGLDRGMTLTLHDDVRVKDAWVLNTPDSHVVQCMAEVENIGSQAIQGKVFFSISERGSLRIVASQGVDLEVPAHGTARVRAVISYDGAKLWDLDDPGLYRMSARWHPPSERGCDRSVLFGFRSFGPEGVGTNALFRLNGRRIKIYSAISWGFWALNGLWPIPELAKKEVAQAKKLGLNCLNFHRNVGKEDVFREHDEQGLMRYMEPGAGKLAIRLPGKDTPADKFSQRFMIAKCLKMVRTFRSHPSLIQYTLHNEIGGAHMKNDNGQNLTNPDVAMILRAIHEEDPSRSVVLNDGFIATGRPQAWLAPYNDELRTSLDGSFGGWWNNHQGAADAWYDVFYKSPNEFTYRREDRTDIVEWGEMEGVAVPDDHPLVIHEIETHGGVSYDLEDHEQVLAGYEKFLTKWGFRKAFPTSEQLFRSIGRKSYGSWEQYLENVRICDDVDFAVVSGWESTAIENHSGIVDNFRNWKSDPAPMQGSLMPVRPVAKQRALVVAMGKPAVFDLYLLNDTEKAVSGRLRFSMTDPAGKTTEIVTVAAPERVRDQFSYLLKEAVTTAPLTMEGMYKFRFALEGYVGATQTREVLVVEERPKLKRRLRVGVAGAPGALRKRLASIDGVMVEEFAAGKTYDVLVTSGLQGEALSDEKIGDDVGEEQQMPASVGTAPVDKRPKIPGKVSDAMLAMAKAGTPLLVVAQRDELADGVARQLAASGAFTYNGQVGDYRAPWMGSWYFLRSHPTYAGLPQNQAMSIYFQADGTVANGLLVDGPGVEVFVGYSRDHDRQVGAGTFTARLGQGKMLFQRVPDMHPVLQQRWVFNALEWLTA
jgi:beta-galactosidase